jgi:predicted RNA-binding Zn-ribbon protein involved in translation (DUF1610 family)
MTTIKTTCSECGDVELRPADLRLELDPMHDAGNYRFNCPLCGHLQRRPANARVVSVLLATGVGYDVLPNEPITEAEIAAFAAALESEEDLVRLIGS